MTRPRLRQAAPVPGPAPLESNPLWGDETRRAVENFRISGRRASDSLIRAYLRIKQAAAMANEKCGRLDPARSAAILQAIEALLAPPLREQWDSLFPIDIYQAGAGTCLNMNLNEVIARLAHRYLEDPKTEVHPNDHVNASQSTNDTYPTAMRLALLEESALLVHETRTLRDAFFELARKNQGILKSGRTHLQDAVPIELSQEFHAWGTALSRIDHWIHGARDTLREIGLGGSAVGDGANVPQGYTSRCTQILSVLCGEPLHPSNDLPYCMQSQASVAWYMAALKMLALELTRICNDLRLMASGPINGLGEIELPQVQAGSSIMPGKINPSIVEMANQVFISVQGYEHSVSLAAQAGQLELNVMMPMMAASAIEATQIATQALRTLESRCIRGIKPRKDVLERQASNTPQVATLLSPTLGYDRTAALVREAISLGRPVLELARARGLIDEATEAALQKKYRSSPK